MIGLFRNIRKKLADENQFLKYSRYALGEIVLVMVGILLALQVNNWNENRKQDAQFRIGMEQIYNALHRDTAFFDFQVVMYDGHINLIDDLLAERDSTFDKFLPYSLYSLTMTNEIYISGSDYHASNLKYSQSNRLQNDIMKEIISYVANYQITNIPFEVREDFLSALKSINLPFPKVDPSFEVAGWITDDLDYYSKKNIADIKSLLQMDSFRAILKTMRTNFTYLKATYFKSYSDGRSLIKLIKNHYPDVKNLFMDVGVKGTAIDGFDNVKGNSTPMKLADVENEIWEVDIYLLEGRIKFRCRDSWAVNWGGDEFPKGKGFQGGPDIIVPEEGNYHIVFKPVTGEYEFTRTDTQPGK